MTTNVTVKTDSYKHSHFLQYPPKTKYVSSYIESRGGNYDQIVFFGLQKWIMDILHNPVTHEDVDEGAEVARLQGIPFNEEGWRYIVNEHGGWLPVWIQSIKEGTVCPPLVPMVQIMNTDPKCAWLTSFLETSLLRAIWYPTTVATISYKCKQKILDGLNQTTDHDEATIEEIASFMLHDFGARGVSSDTSAAIGGLAHLLNFLGTDTMEAIMCGREYYNTPCAGFSVPAAEHSTITSWGKDRESDAYKNMLNQFMGQPIISIVSDSYDIYNAINNIYGDELHELVIDAADKGSRLVVRPDSGNPIKVPVECIELLMEKFGYRVNRKGYKVLPDHIRVLQGDGINVDSIGSIISALIDKNISVENIVFGMGSGLLQQCNRDTLKFAMKASYADTDRGDTMVFKDPITDKGKVSKKGRMSVLEAGKTIYVVDEKCDDEQYHGCGVLMETVYDMEKDIDLSRYTIDDVKKIMKSYQYDEVVLDKSITT